MERSVAGWRASTPSRTAESVDREREVVGIAWARVERRRPEANVNSYRGSSNGSTISTKGIIGARYNQLGMEQRT